MKTDQFAPVFGADMWYSGSIDTNIDWKFIMHINSLSVALAAGLCMAVASPAISAAFTVFEEGTPNVLGTFEAPMGGGGITSGLFSLSGGTFDTLVPPPNNPIYDAVENWIVGSGSSFGSFTNSVAFNTQDFVNNPITCGIGECVLSFTNSGGGTPPEWYLDFVPANPNLSAPIDLGYYEITTAPIPLPAAAWLLLAGVGGITVAGRRKG